MPEKRLFNIDPLLEGVEEEESIPLIPTNTVAPPLQVLEPEEQPPIPPVGQRIQGRQRETFRQSLLSTSIIPVDDPNFEVSQQTGFSMEALKDNPEAAERIKQSLDITDEEIDDLHRLAPLFVERFLSDPNFAAATRDEIEHVSAFEQNLEDLKDYLGDIGVAAGLGVDNYKQAWDGAVWMSQVLAGGEISPERMQEILDREEVIRRKDEEIEERGFITGIPLAVAEQGVNLVTSVLAMFAGRAVGRGVGAGIGALGATPVTVAGVSATGSAIGERGMLFLHAAMLEGGHAMVDYATMTDEDGNSITPEDAAAFALMTGGLAGMVEAATFPIVAKVLPGGRTFLLREAQRTAVRKLLANKTSRELVLRAFRDLGVAVSVEAIQEGLQEFIQIFTGELGKYSSPDAFEGQGLDDILRKFIFTDEEGNFKALAQIWQAMRTGAQVGLGAGGPATTVRVVKAVKTDGRGPSIESALPDEPTITPIDETVDPNTGRPLGEEEFINVEIEEGEEAAEGVAREVEVPISESPEDTADAQILMQGVEESNAIEREQRFFDYIGEFAKGAKSIKRTPQEMAEYVEETAEEFLGNQSLRFIRVDAQTLSKHINENPDALDDFRKVLPDLEVRVNQALRVDGDVLFPLGEYVVYVGGTDSHGKLKEHLKLRAGATTAFEAAFHEDNLKEEAARLMENQVLTQQDREDFERIHADLTEKYRAELEETGRVGSSQVIIDQAGLAARAVINLSIASGKPLEEVAPPGVFAGRREGRRAFIEIEGGERPVGGIVTQPRPLGRSFADREIFLNSLAVAVGGGELVPIHKAFSSELISALKNSTLFESLKQDLPSLPSELGEITDERLRETIQEVLKEQMERGAEVETRFSKKVKFLGEHTDLEFDVDSIAPRMTEEEAKDLGGRARPLTPGSFPSSPEAISGKPDILDQPDMSRRGFLKILGAATAAISVGPVTVSKEIISLKAKEVIGITGSAMRNSHFWRKLVFEQSTFALEMLKDFNFDVDVAETFEEIKEEKEGLKTLAETLINTGDIEPELWKTGDGSEIGWNSQEQAFDTFDSGGKFIGQFENAQDAFRSVGAEAPSNVLKELEEEVKPPSEKIEIKELPVTTRRGFLPQLSKIFSKELVDVLGNPKLLGNLVKELSKIGVDSTEEQVEETATLFLEEEFLEEQIEGEGEVLDQPEMNRRTFLKSLGIIAGSIAVVGKEVTKTITPSLTDLGLIQLSPEEIPNFGRMTQAEGFIDTFAGMDEIPKEIKIKVAGSVKKFNERFEEDEFDELFEEFYEEHPIEGFTVEGSEEDSLVIIKEPITKKFFFQVGEEPPGLSRDDADMLRQVSFEDAPTTLERVVDLLRDVNPTLFEKVISEVDNKTSSVKQLNNNASKLQRDINILDDEIRSAKFEDEKKRLIKQKQSIMKRRDNILDALDTLRAPPKEIGFKSATPQIQLPKIFSQELLNVVSSPELLSKLTDEVIALGEKVTSEQIEGASRLLLEQQLPGGAEPEGGTEVLDQLEPVQVPTFYSAVLRAVELSSLPKGTPEQWMGIIRKAPNVKKEELEFVDVEGFLGGRESVTRGELQEFISKHNVKIETVNSVERGEFDREHFVLNEIDFSISNNLRVEIRDRFEVIWERDHPDKILSADVIRERNEWVEERITENPPRVWSTNLGFEIQFSPLGSEEYSISGPDAGYIASYTTFEDAEEAIFEIERGGGFAEQTVDGGTNYVERLLKWSNAPEGVIYNEEHFAGHENVIGYFRGKTRLFKGLLAFIIDEMQSGWHQRGHREGYVPLLDPESIRRREELFLHRDTLQNKILASAEEILKGTSKQEKMGYIVNSAKDKGFKVELTKTKEIGGEYTQFAITVGRKIFRGNSADGLTISQVRPIILKMSANQELKLILDKIKKLKKQEIGIPNAPFKSNWHELLLKQAIRDVVEGGHDAIGWSPSRIIYKRYGGANFSSISKIEWERDDESQTVRLVGQPSHHNLPPMEFTNIPIKEMEEFIGARGVASDALIQEITEGKKVSGILTKKDESSALGFLLAKPFLHNLYDKKAVQYMRKIGKKHGVTVEKRVDDDGNEWWFMPIPNSLKDVVLRKGQPLFQEEDGSTSGESRGFFSPDENVIGLTSKANFSTFMHEMAHWYLHTLNRLSQDPGVPDVVRQDLEVAFRWMGITSFDEVTREHHEMYADGFLKFLQEGSSPTLERKMQAVFHRFRRWLSSIYKEGQLPELNDEIRGHFDRMLATDEEIAQARASSGFQPAFASAREMGVTEQEFNDYLDNADMMASEAKRRLDGDELRRQKGKKTKGYRNRFAVEKRRIVEGMKKLPVHQAKQFLMHGTLPDGNKSSGIHKLDHNKVIELFKDNKDLIRFPGGPHTITVRDGTGLDPEWAAQLFGFAGGFELLKAVFAHTNEKVNVEATKMAGLNLEKKGNIAPEVDDKTTRANEAVQNHHLENVLLAELEAAERKTGKRTIPVRRLKIFAEGFINDTPVGKIRPEEHLREGRKQANLGISAARRGDMEALAEARRRQLMSLYLYRAARDKTKRLSKMVTDLKRINKSNSRKAIGVEAMEQIDDIMSRFTLTQRRPQVTAKTQTLDEYLDTVYPVRVDPADIEGQVHYKSLPFGKFEALYESIMSLAHVGRDQQKILKEGEKIEQALFAAELKDVLEENIPVSEGKIELDDPFLKPVSDTILSLHALIRRMSHLAKVMDGFKANGFVFRNYILPAAKGSDDYFSRMRDITDKVAKLYERYEGRDLRRKIPIKNEEFSLRKEKMLAIVLNMGNEENLDRLLEMEQYHNHISAKSLENIKNSLEKKDMDFIQGIWDLMEFQWDDVVALERRTTGRTPKRVQPTAIVTPWGTYRGGYYPIVYDPRKVSKEEKRKARRNLTAEEFLKQRQGYAFAMTSRGHTLPRKSSAGQILNLDMASVISRHFDDVILDITHREIIMNFNKMMQNNEISSTMQKHLGNAAYRSTFVNWVDRMAQSDDIQRDAFQKMVGRFRRGIAAATMGFKWTTIIQQPVGITQSVVTIGPTAIWNGMGQIYRAIEQDPVTMSGIRQLLKDVTELSPFMNNRTHRVNREIDELFRNRTKFQTPSKIVNRTLSWVEVNMFMPLAKLQYVVDLITWLGEFNKHQIAGEDVETSKALADRAVKESQSSGARVDLSAFETGPETVKIFSTFANFFGSTYNLTADSITRAKLSEDKFAFAHLLGDFLLLYTLPAVLVEAILLRGIGEPDEPEEWAAWAAKAQFRYMAGTIPVLRDISGYLEYEDSAPAGLATKEIAQFGQEAYEAIAGLTRGDLSEFDMTLLKKSLMVESIVGFRFPAAQINTTINQAEKMMDGEIKNPYLLLLRTEE